MSSPVQVKHEPGGDAFCVDTDSESEDIDIDKLQPLASRFASLSKFPVGCKVWYDLRCSPETNHLQAKSARVEEVFIHVENGRRVYKVKSEAADEHEISLYEDQLVYGINCTVRVTKVGTDETMDGVVVYLRREKGIDGRRRATYAVQYSTESYISIEPEVAADRIKYRAEDCGIGAHGKESNIINKEKETTCTQEGDENKEKKEVEVSSHSFPAESFDHAEYDDHNDCNLSNPIDTTRWEPPSPPPPQRKRSSGFNSIVNHRPTKVAKIEVRREVRGEVKKDASKYKVGSTAAVLILTIPSWWINKWGKENRRQLYSRLIGKAKVIKSSTNCLIRISGHDTNERMRITIESLSRDPKSQLNCIRYANRVIEKSLVEYLACENSEKRLLYDLAVSAIDSCQLIQRDINSGLLQKEIVGSRRASKQWWRLFELPCGRDMHPHDLSILEELKVPKGSDCKIEVFKRSVKVPLASPYVLVSGTKQLDVKNAAMMVADAVRRHQRFCQCHPRW